MPHICTASSSGSGVAGVVGVGVLVGGVAVADGVSGPAVSMAFWIRPRTLE